MSDSFINLWMNLKINCIDMLTVKKHSDSPDLVLSLKIKERFFNATLLTAFGWSAGFHLLSILLFSVGVITFSGINLIHPPVEVFTDKSFSPADSLVFNDFETERKVRSIIPPPPLPSSRIDILPKNLSFDPLTLSIQPSILTSPVFLQDRDLSWIAFSPPVDLPLSVQIEWSGPFQPKELSNPEILQLHPPEILSNPQKATFSAHVDTRSGTIFGLILDTSSGNRAFDRWAQTTLSALRFSPDPSGYIRSTTISIRLLSKL